MNKFKRKLKPDDILVWSCGSWCFRSELYEMSHMSVDYETLWEGSQAWKDFEI